MQLMDNLDLIERGVCSSVSCSCEKLHVTDWMDDISGNGKMIDAVEVRFKNTRKDFFRNVNHLKLKPGDLVAVEANPGHDIGIVSLTGELVHRQMKKHRATTVNGELRKIYRLARPLDIEKWKGAISLEYSTMIETRKIAADLKLDMKIGDVEYQGDCNKAIFYYIADGRVDFRELIKILADRFHIRVEMRQIGARQEAGRIGGIGPCGRELCCASWFTDFVSVSTNAARCQDISLNPQKLAGQCGKLKCCLNYELDAYLDAQKSFPPNSIPLETKFGTYQFLKADIFKGIYWYFKVDNAPSALVPVSVDTVKKIQKLNHKGQKPEKLTPDGADLLQKTDDAFFSMAGEEDINRFNKAPVKKRKKRRRKPGNVSNRNQRQRSAKNTRKK